MSLGFGAPEVRHIYSKDESRNNSELQRSGISTELINTAYDMRKIITWIPAYTGMTKAPLCILF